MGKMGKIGPKSMKIGHIMARGSHNGYMMASNDSLVLISIATDDLVRFWSHSDIGKYRFQTNSS